MNDDKELKELREKTKQVETMVCTCSSFSRQYDGCNCEKGKLSKEIKKRVNALLKTE